MHRHAALSLVALVVGLVMTANAAKENCFKYEDLGDKVWAVWKDTHSQNDFRACSSLCQGYQLAAIHHGTNCKCGDKIPPVILPKSRCDTPCPGDPEQKCGGKDAVSVFPVFSMPDIQGTPLGCFEDTAERVWKTGKITLQNSSPQRCFQACRGFRYAGLEHGYQCFCGDTLPPKALPRSKCQTECYGVEGLTCGGGWALEVFELSLSNEVTPRAARPECPVCPAAVEFAVHSVGKKPWYYMTQGVHAQQALP